MEIQHSCPNLFFPRRILNFENLVMHSQYSKYRASLLIQGEPRMHEKLEAVYIYIFIYLQGINRKVR